MYAYIICLYLCSPLFDVWIGSKSFEGTWMDRQLLSDRAATGFSQYLGDIKRGSFITKHFRYLKLRYSPKAVCKANVRENPSPK